MHPFFERQIGLSWRPCRGRPCRLLFRTCYERHRSIQILVLRLHPTWNLVEIKTYNLLINAPILPSILTRGASELLFRGVETLVEVVFPLRLVLLNTRRRCVVAGGSLRGISWDGVHLVLSA